MSIQDGKPNGCQILGLIADILNPFLRRSRAIAPDDCQLAAESSDSRSSLTLSTVNLNPQNQNVCHSPHQAVASLPQVVVGNRTPTF